MKCTGGVLLQLHTFNNFQIKVSAGLGVQTHVALTNMDSPIGRAVGNSLEVAEAIDCLKGNGPHDVIELVATLGKYVL